MTSGNRVQNLILNMIYKSNRLSKGVGFTLNFVVEFCVFRKKIAGALNGIFFIKDLNLTNCINI